MWRNPRLNVTLLCVSTDDQLLQSNVVPLHSGNRSEGGFQNCTNVRPMSAVTWVDPCLVWCWTIENHDHPCQKSHSNRQWNLPWPKHNEPIRAIDQSELSVSNLPQQLSLPWVPHKNHLILRRLFQQLLTRILIELLISNKLTRHQYMAIYQQGSPDDMSPK